MDIQASAPQSNLSTSVEGAAALPIGEAREVVLSQLVTDVYDESEPKLRARLLECLIRPLRPLGLVAVAAGAFSAFLHRDSWGRFSVPLDTAVRVTSEQVLELARFVEQAQPEAFRQIAIVMADNPVCLKTLSGSLLLMTLRMWRPGQPVSRR